MLTMFHGAHKIIKNWFTHNSAFYVFAGSSWQHTCLPCPVDEESPQVVYKEGVNVLWTLWAVTSVTVVVKKDSPAWLCWRWDFDGNGCWKGPVESPSLLSFICQEQGYILARLVISGCVSLYDVYIKATHVHSAGAQRFVCSNSRKTGLT